VKPAGYFIAGTDTGVGKTWVTCGLIAALQASGQTAGGMKPVLAGSDGDDVDEIVAVSRYSSQQPGYCSYRLRDPTAPSIAAEREGIRIDIGAICRDFRILSAIQRRTIVEGCGGWLCPLTETKTMADLATALGLPVILVVGLRLGCLNHTLLSVEAIEKSGLPLAGWVANHIDAAFSDAAANVAYLRRHVAAPLLAELPWAPGSPLPAPQLAPAARLLGD